METIDSAKKQHFERGKKRVYYGLMSGYVGISVNILLFIIKFFIGQFTKSVAISADAFNNLGDIGSSVVTIIGFKLASRPPDKDHPYGYGRIEYITSFLISISVVLIGIELFRNSLGRIINPEKVVFNIVSFIILLLSAGVKFWLGRFNANLAKKIESGALNASAFDSFGDVISTFAVSISFLLSNHTDLPVDGFIGIMVSLFIVYTGYNLIKESVDVLIGTKPEKELIEDIQKVALTKKGISGIHDMMVHNYGPGRCIVTFHAEVPESIPIDEAHEIIDELERELMEELGVFAVVHMDPVNFDDEELNKTRVELEDILKDFPEILSFHDLRVVGRGRKKNIIFDIVVSHDVKNEEERELKKEITNKIKERYPGYNPVIVVDREYV
ncbi:cation diffusion facilitator family transporter [Thermovenabulum gondwanense]|uniref:Ferrous-iron efflux pump FieF n=1 Tax=Thermovenabulum gondwanense TaxID=520767 RepID=A0A162MU62_9FIRM|nr:cation diffusion facilitator family transporter [Thermovenabulum gondwanense]KYO67347.1 Ferrous-iron efflux pump FieF [Thermovenabulum gondwanense]